MKPLSGPDETMTRAMFVSVLGTSPEGIADATAETPSVTGFTDVVSTEYYASHVHWAAENGVVEGYSDTTYAPYDNMTREHMVYDDVPLCQSSSKGCHR